jgi:hypothetical protein
MSLPVSCVSPVASVSLPASTSVTRDPSVRSTLFQLQNSPPSERAWNYPTQHTLRERTLTNSNLAQKTDRFYGFTENRRELDMDMREMVDKVKRGEELYGKSQLTEYMQGVASRQSRYSGIWIHMMPWFNFVNHNQHGVDTAKYYQQAERELEAEKA